MSAPYSAEKPWQVLAIYTVGGMLGGCNRSS